MGVKKLKTGLRREQIAQAAIKIIGKEGLQKFTTARLAREVGISEAALYRHFDSKNDILAAVIDDISATLQANVEKARKENATGLEKLEHIFRLHLELIEKKNGLPRIVFSSETIFVKGLKEKLLQFINSYMNSLVEIIKEGVADGSIRKLCCPEMTATTVIGTVQVNALRRVLSGFKYSPVEQADFLWKAMKESLEPR